MDTFSTDILVVGSGLAGLSAALAARRSGSRVAVLAEDNRSSATALSGGGFRAPGDGYTPEQLFLDVIDHGAYLAERPLAKALANDSPATRFLLEKAGVRLGPYPHGFRVSQDGGRPGHLLLAALEASARQAGVEWVRGMGWQVITGPDSGVAGVLAYDAARADWTVVSAKVVVLAAGGAAACFLKTDNSPDATGDALAMAYRAGAVLADMEFVQYWPLVAFSPDGSTCLGPSDVSGKRLFVGGRRDVSESVGLPAYASGGGNPFDMARRVYQEITPASGDPENDLSLHLAPSVEAIEAASPEAVAVSPAAHHTLGGVVCGDHGQTRVGCLFAAGEAVAGVHGADRLSGSGLSEAAVIGRRAGEHASAVAKDVTVTLDRGTVERLARDIIRRTMAALEATEPGAPTPREATRRVRSAMWRNSSLVRSRESLDAAQSEINKIKRALPLNADPGSGPDMRAALKTLNLLLVSESIARSARYRRESRGVHYRADYPERDDADWLRHVRVRELSGEMSLDISQGLELMEP